MNAIVLLKLASRLDTLPSRGDLDEYTLLLDANRLVEGNQLLSLRLCCLLVEGKARVDLRGHTSGDDGKNLLAEFHKLRIQVLRSDTFTGSVLLTNATYQAVESMLRLLINVTSLLLRIFDSRINQPCVAGLVRSCEDERWVRCGVL